jgi:hypothetical protein
MQTIKAHDEMQTQVILGGVHEYFKYFKNEGFAEVLAKGEVWR